MDNLLFIAICCLFVVCCSNTREVSSFTTIHENMVFESTSGQGILNAVDTYEERGSFFGNDGVMLRPNVGDFSLSVKFSARPEEGRDVVYEPFSYDRVENEFLVIKGPPPVAVVVPLTKRGKVAITGASPEISAKLHAIVPSSDKIQETISVVYEIGWDELILTGTAHIARSSHEEADYWD